MGYFDWHAQPGYFGDVTRHFASAARILDVGCGSAWLANHFQNYTGVDGSPEAVAAAQGRGLNVQLVDLDGPLPFADETFDGVVMKDVLEHLGDPVQAVREARRVLKPGGKVFASSPDAQDWVWDDYTHRRPFSRKAFGRLFSDQGFTVERLGYESIMKGSSFVSGLTRAKRRPWFLRLAGALSFLPRNVWILARR